MPLALTYDTGGPMARSVYDAALALGVMTGIDAEDEATKKSEGRFERDYTQHLRRGALTGARIGIARDFMGKDAGADLVVEQAIATLRTLGAVVVDPIKYPDHVIQARLGLTISFLGTAFSEAKLLGYGYDFEQATKACVLPKHTRALASDVLVRVVSR